MEISTQSIHSFRKQVVAVSLHRRDHLTLHEFVELMKAAAAGATN
jgi:hypothetical protein